jgi:NAD(P)H-hydrate epimerase
MLHPLSPLALLTTQQVRVIDELAVQSGTSVEKLMGRAGAAVAHEVMRRFPKKPVLVLVGPGHNGGDGLVAAAELKEAGWLVTVAAPAPEFSMTGLSALARRRWNGDIMPITPELLNGIGLVIDALFGVGLNRETGPELANLFSEIEKRKIPVLAVDIPTGIEGNTGCVLGQALHAEVTVTFARKKPGHLLLPGRAYAGELVVADIGLPTSVYEAVQPNLFENGPDLWRSALPKLDWAKHKYSRGAAVVAGGPMTGAARLAARAAQRVGAGVVHVTSPAPSAPLYATTLTSCIIRAEAFTEVLNDTTHKFSAALLGPGYGIGQPTRDTVQALLAKELPTVLDADALTSFTANPALLLSALHEKMVITPHEGEFRALFSYTGDNLRRASLAAVASGAIVVLKGPATIIAAPEGHCIINSNAPPTLATAGAGDVLAGLITGLLAQGMPAFYASAAAVWLHGEAATHFGPGLIAEDLEGQLPAVLRALT